LATKHEHILSFLVFTCRLNSFQTSKRASVKNSNSKHKFSERISHVLYYDEDFHYRFYAQIIQQPIFINMRMVKYTLHFCHNS